MSLDKKILDSLFCPACHAALKSDQVENTLSCQKCNITYLVENGIPIMLIPSSKEELQQKIQQWNNNAIVPKCISYKTVQLLRSPAPFHWFGKKKIFETIFSRIKTDGLYLDVGGTGTIHPSVLTVNIAPSSDTDIVADAQLLPFKDNSVDGVFILLVLEHVPCPFEIAKEIHRVLKPGGFVFATLPFLQVMHENPKDYFRYTPDGIRELFLKFEEQSLQVASGPSATVIWVLKEYIALLCPFSNYSLIYVSVREIAGWILFPLILFDLYLKKKKRVEKLASFYSYLGIKGGVK